MAGLRVKGIVFDMYGTLVDVGAVAEACKEVAPEPGAFNTQWRAKQLEYTFLRTLMGKYRDFWPPSHWRSCIPISVDSEAVVDEMMVFGTAWPDNPSWGCGNSSGSSNRNRPAEVEEDTCFWTYN